MEFLTASLVGWSRAQFAMTAMYHWVFVPLTLGLGIIMAVMETLYVRTGKEEWKSAARFWMRLFGINFRVRYRNRPRARISVRNQLVQLQLVRGGYLRGASRHRGHTRLLHGGYFHLAHVFRMEEAEPGGPPCFHVAHGSRSHHFGVMDTGGNAWMQYPVGMEFNPDTVRNEMHDFWSILLSPVAVNKFCHTVLSGWVLGALFVTGISAWFLLRRRNTDFAVRSMKVGTVFGVVASLLVIATGHMSAYNVAHHQPMKLAAMEAHYEGYEGVELIGVGIINPQKKSWDDGVQPVVGRIAFPKMLSFLGFSDFNAFVPGIRDIIEGGYELPDGETALSFEEKRARGRLAIQALADYRTAVEAGDDEAAALYKEELRRNYAYFGYGYLETPEDLIPPVGLTFYSFRIMVILGMWFILLFLVAGFFVWKRDVARQRWLLWVALLTIPLGYLAGEFGWVVAEVGRQPWAIQDILPVQAAISSISAESVRLTFFIFLVLFTALFVAEVRIMLRQIKRGPVEEIAAGTTDIDKQEK